MRKTAIAAALILATGIFSSCIKDTSRLPVTGETTLTLYVALPGQEESENHTVSRSGTPQPGTEEESAIRTLTFFIFDGSGNREEYQSVEIDASGNSSDPMWDSGRKALRMTVTPGTKQIYCIANWSTIPNAEMGDLSSITTIAALTGSVRYYNSVPENPPVMSGNKTVTLTGAEQELSIDLVRQVARVQIYPMLSPSLAITAGLSVTLEGVMFRNMNKSAYIYARSPIASPDNTTFNQTDFAGVTSAPVTATDKENAVLYGYNYYIPENIASGETTATSMVLQFSFNGTTTYYEIVLNDDASSPHTQCYAIERNHSYAYYVTLDGIGSPSYPGAPVRSSMEQQPISYEMITEKM